MRSSEVLQKPRLMRNLRTGSAHWRAQTSVWHKGRKHLRLPRAPAASRYRRVRMLRSGDDSSFRERTAQKKATTFRIRFANRECVRLGGVLGEQRHWGRIWSRDRTGRGSRTSEYLTPRSSGWGSRQTPSPPVEARRTLAIPTFCASTRAPVQIPGFSFPRVVESNKRAPSPVCGHTRSLGRNSTCAVEIVTEMSDR